jgi:hypothetical protein
MENIPEHIVCESAPVPRPSLEDWDLIAKGTDMTYEVLNMPWLRKYIDHPIFGVWYWQNLCLRIGLVTGGVFTQEDYDMIQFGVQMHAVRKMCGVPRMVFSQHLYCDENCYYCTIYRNSLLTEFGFELSKFLRYDGVDGSVFDDYANDAVGGSVFEDDEDIDDGDYYTNGDNDEGHYSDGDGGNGDDFYNDRW